MDPGCPFSKEPDPFGGPPAEIDYPIARSGVVSAGERSSVVDPDDDGAAVSQVGYSYVHGEG